MKKGADSDDEMPPELEDVPEDLLAASKKKESNTFIGDYTQEIPQKPSTVYEETKKLEETNKPKKSEASFGFKKGFLDSGSSEKKSQPKKEEPIIVKPTKDKDDWKRFPEVQNNMKQTVLDKKDQWMTPELLEAIAKNPNLMKLFTNPEYMQAIQQLQVNPTQVMEKYRNNVEFTQLMVEFSRIMGTHFGNLGEKEKEQQQQQQQQQQKQAAFNQPPADKEVEEILKDPKVKSLISYLQKNEKVDFQRIMQSDPSLAMKLQFLIKKGYINLNAG